MFRQLTSVEYYPKWTRMIVLSCLNKEQLPDNLGDLELIHSNEHPQFIITGECAVLRNALRNETARLTEVALSSVMPSTFSSMEGLRVLVPVETWDILDEFKVYCYEVAPWVNIITMICIDTGNIVYGAITVDEEGKRGEAV